MIVCGFDGSPYALEALEVACGLARKLAAPLQVVRVLDVLGIEYDDELRARYRAELENEVARAGGGEATIRILAGAPADDLLVAASEASAALLVIGATGLGRHDLAARLGSTAGAIVSRSAAPVLVVRRPTALLDAVAGRAALRTLVTVGPRSGTHAVAWTRELLATVVGDLRAVSVVDDGDPAPPADVEPLARDDRAVASIIAERAAREHIGLVVVGREQRRHRLSRSTARAIVHETATNVACVPEPR